MGVILWYFSNQKVITLPISVGNADAMRLPPRWGKVGMGVILWYFSNQKVITLPISVENADAMRLPP